MADQELSVKITGDTSELVKATATAARELDELKKDVTQLDQETIEITPDLELSRIQRDMANLNKALDGVERRKANPDVGLDTVQLLRDEAKVRKALDDLDKRRVDVEASMTVDATGMQQFQTVISDVVAGFQGGGGGGFLGGLTAARGGMAAMGAEGAAAATGVGALALALVAAGKGAWELGQQAADVQTSVVQLDALTQGMGEETFGELQKWAAATPFAIDDATLATKKLVAAGEPLKDIPDWLNDIGNVAAATGVNIGQVGTVFGQMVSKGKASYEELQQLAEAGIPVWQTLADKLGLSVAETQKLATEGKLGADAIDLVRESLNQMYPDAMQRQADTFNGQMSTFQDTLDQTGQTLGTLFLPAMTEALELFNRLLAPILSGAQALSDWNKELEDATGGGFVQFLSPAIGALDLLNGGIDDSKKETKSLAESTDDLAAKVLAGMQTASKSVEDYAEELRDAADAYAEIGGTVRTKVEFIVSRADLEAEISKAVGEGVELPAKLNIRQVGGLSDVQQELLGNVSSYVEQGLEEGARRAKLAEAMGTSFDAGAFYQQLRTQTRGLLIDVGIDRTEVDRVLANIVGLPKQTTITAVADVTAAQQQLAAVSAPTTKRVTTQVLPPLAQQQNTFLDLIAPRTVAVQPEPVPAAVASTGSTLETLTRERPAEVRPMLDIFSASIVRHQLDQLAEDRYSTIYVDTVKRGGGGGAAAGAGGRGGAIVPTPAGDTTGGLLRAGRAFGDQPAGLQFVAAPGGTSRQPGGTAGQGAAIRLAPKQIPVKVYLDGSEIADRLELRARKLATSSSLRRLA